MKRISNLFIGMGAGLVGLASVAGSLVLAHKYSKKRNAIINAKISENEKCECCGCNKNDCNCDCCEHDNSVNNYEPADDVDFGDLFEEEDLDCLFSLEDNTKTESVEDIEDVKRDRDHWKNLYEEEIKNKNHMRKCRHRRKKN